MYAKTFLSVLLSCSLLPNGYSLPVTEEQLQTTTPPYLLLLHRLKEGLQEGPTFQQNDTSTLPPTAPPPYETTTAVATMATADIEDVTTNTEASNLVAIKLYDGSSFNTELTTILTKENECYTLPKDLWDRASSINTGGTTILVYATEDCDDSDIPALRMTVNDPSCQHHDLYKCRVYGYDYGYGSFNYDNEARSIKRISGLLVEVANSTPVSEVAQTSTTTMTTKPEEVTSPEIVPIKLCEHKDFGGKCTTIMTRENECYDLPREMWDRTSSINNNETDLILYGLQDCEHTNRIPSFEMTKNDDPSCTYSDLFNCKIEMHGGRLEYNDQIRSIKRVSSQRTTESTLTSTIQPPQPTTDQVPKQPMTASPTNVDVVPVTLCDQLDLAGECIAVPTKKGQCYNLPTQWWDRANSVDIAGSDVILYSWTDCNDNDFISVEVTGNDATCTGSDLSKCNPEGRDHGFANHVRSIKRI